MYNKISSIILNSNQSSGFSDVYIAQPDPFKEGLAGRVFLLAEIGAKKSDAKKMFEFLINSLEENYYDDEKIMLREKIEELKIENIFEAAVSKTNKALNDFLAISKIKINSAMTGVTAGLIFENKLYFSTYGRNRAFLVYQIKDRYEIINVEASATDAVNHSPGRQLPSSTVPTFFSSVISGEIPSTSYFLFTSEALPEYISQRDLIAIVTKLPPIVAAEQIKNILSKINSFIPFLGIIIKNTIGLDKQDEPLLVEIDDTAHKSLSTLKNTEDVTERILEPAGIISLSKASQKLFNLLNSLKSKSKPFTNKSARRTLEPATDNKLDLGTINTFRSSKKDAPLVKDKIFFQKRPNFSLGKILKNLLLLPQVFNLSYLKSLLAALRKRLDNLGGKHRLLLVIFSGVVVIFLLSLTITSYSKKQEAAKNHYNNILVTINEQQEKIDQALLYDNNEAARNNLAEAWSLTDLLPRQKKDQIAVYEELAEKLKAQEDKIQKITRINNPTMVNDLIGLGVNNITFADGKIYAASYQKIYAITPNSSESSVFEVTGATNLSEPQFDYKNLIYYRDSGRILRFDLKTKQFLPYSLSEDLANRSASYKVYNSNLYTLDINEGQIYRSNLVSAAYSSRLAWLKETADLLSAKDLAIDGNIYVLKSDGQVLKFRLGKLEEYKSISLSPGISKAEKIVTTGKFVYILSPEDRRLAVLALADGRLISQYHLESLSELKDFTVDENNRSTYLLNGEAVYKIELNQ